MNFYTRQEERKNKRGNKTGRGGVKIDETRNIIIT